MAIYSGTKYKVRLGPEWKEKVRDHRIKVAELAKRLGWSYMYTYARIDGITRCTLKEMLALQAAIHDAIEESECRRKQNPNEGTVPAGLSVMDVFERTKEDRNDTKSAS